MTERLVGRDDAVARLRSVLDDAAAGRRALVLVCGTAGIGKTSLVRAATAGALCGWGTCVDGARAGGYWPWTRALDSLARQAPGTVTAADAPLLATIAPAFGEPRPGGTGERDRLLLMDAVATWLERVAADRTVVVVLDDLQWADESSLALLEFVARSPEPARLCVVGCYRPEELTGTRRERLARLAVGAEHVELGGLDRAAVAELVAQHAGDVDPVTVDAVYRRAGGHPVFTRELALLRQPDADAPRAVRDAIDQRVRLLPAETQRVAEVAAMAGNDVHPDVVAAATGLVPATLEEALAPAVDAGVLVRDGAGRTRFAHDLYRETLAGRVPHDARPRLHQAVGAALEARAGRGGEVSAADAARHFAAAVAVDGTHRAARWARAAADRDLVALAFTEAAGHLRRWRAAVADAAVEVDDDELVDVLLAEADALSRAGAAVDARGLLRVARDVAERAGRPERQADVALAVAALGNAFANRRDEVVRDLEHALDAVAGRDPRREALVAAALARELQHSVAEDRPRAEPLSDRALAYARTADDAETLHACLLARHDVLWSPGTDRVALCQELVAAAQRLGDDERRAQASLLLANALLESGSAAFRPALDACLELLDRLGQPRHRYVAATRRAALALLDGDLHGAERLVEEAADLGRRIREPDAENVRMSQRLELVRARGDAAGLAAFAAEAVAHWTGAPVHAHGVAAGFLARAGDLDAARRHVATVADLGTWRADRSYLWSVFVRELAVAAAALGDRDLCAELLADVEPVAATCGVNGAVVAFAGSHAQTAGLLANALGRDGAGYLRQAAETYARLGAAGWTAPATGAAVLRRTGRTWQVEYDGARATLPHTKGLADLATLLAAPGKDVHALDLYGSGDRSAPAGEVSDARALAAYRQRLAELDDEITDATDDAALARAEEERRELVAELGRVARQGGGGRVFANYPAERARKAVAGRIRDAIRRLRDDVPDLAAHLDRTVVTGTWCRYRPDDDRRWHVEP